MSDMTEKLKAARALGYLEGLSVWLWEHMTNVDEGYCEQYDRAVETLRKAIDWGDGE
jgi:hypothetical protein